MSKMILNLTDEMAPEDWTKLGSVILELGPEARANLREAVESLPVRTLKRVFAEQVKVMNEAYNEYKRIEEATNVIKNAITSTIGDKAHG